MAVALAQTHSETPLPPARRSAVANSPTVAPLVKTSSSMATCAPARLSPDREGVADIASPLPQIKADLRGCITRARGHLIVQLYTQRAGDRAGDFQCLIKSALRQSGSVQWHGNEAIDGRWFDAGEALTKQIRKDRRMRQPVWVFQAMNQLIDGRGIGEGGDGRVKRRWVGLTGAESRRRRRVRQWCGSTCAG